MDIENVLLIQELAKEGWEFELTLTKSLYFIARKPAINGYYTEHFKSQKEFDEWLDKKKHLTKNRTNIQERLTNWD